MVGADDRAPEPRSNGASSTTDDEIAALRALLIGPEQRRLSTLQARLDDRDARAEDVAAVLPQVLLQHADDPRLTHALSPPLERALTQSVQRNPQPLADALFPVMGPAIRKAVSAGLSGMVESINRTLELALSPRSLRWRLEALRSGRSFAEIVLAKTLVYRVEQAFLIERTSGLLLQHVQAPGVVAQDADMVSGMLTAIRDFVQDSFKVAAGESLETMQVGELTVWVEPGPRAIIATVIRGTAPRDLRPVLQEAVETIHLQFGETLASFDGDATAFAGTRPALEACLQMQYRKGERKASPRGARVIAAVVVVALLLALGLWYRRSDRHARYVSALRAEPGLVVLSTSTSGGRLVVSGLRDPLARDPLSLAGAGDLAPTDIVGQWAGYQALDPPIVLARAQQLLAPPAGVTLQLDEGVLTATGASAPAWVAEARRRAPFVAGVRRFDAAGALGGAIRTAIDACQAAPILFVRGSTRLATGQDDVLAQLVRHLRELDTLAAAAGLRFQIAITGHTDADGPDDANVPLSRSRAEFVRGALAALTHLDITTSGEGSREPAVASGDEPGKQQNRRVTVRVTGRTEDGPGSGHS